MAQPVLVHAYTSPKPTPAGSPSGRSSHVLPPIAAFAFADILRAADSAELQSAIDGIAGICAKNRMSLAEEYGSHLPPVGEITAVAPEPMPVPARQQQYSKSNMRRALTSVPEVSSGSSDGSVKGRSRSILGFRLKQEVMRSPMRNIRISSTGRTISLCGTTAMSTGAEDDDALSCSDISNEGPPNRILPVPCNGAALSLQHLMSIDQERLARVR